MFQPDLMAGQRILVTGGTGLVNNAAGHLIASTEWARFGVRLNAVAPGQCEWLTGQTIAMDGGNALATGGTFHELRDWSDADWQAARERIEAQNAKDKTQR